MKHSILAVALAVALTLPQSALVQAADMPVATSHTETERGYLGVTISQLPYPLRAQLPTTVPRAQGVLVEQVIEDSPAAKAGLKPFDILLQYNDQKLFSPEQLTKLVGSDSSGKPVKLTIVHGGKISTLEVTLAESLPPLSTEQRSRPVRPSLPFNEYHRRGFPGGGPQHAPQATEEDWESFDSLSLEKLDSGQYKAAIGYLAEDGTHKHLDFQGTREEIRQQILAQKDLPDIEREQLLDALTSRDDVFNFGSGPFEQGFMLPPWSGWGWRPDF